MILVDSRHDIFHRIDLPGGYEWTYYDGFDERTGNGFTAIWFRGVPMSPHYAAAIDRIDHVSGTGANPRDFAAFAFNLYAGGSQVGSFFVEGREQVAGANEEIVFDGNRLVIEEQESEVWLSRRLVIDGQIPLTGTRLQGEIVAEGPRADLEAIVHTGRPAAPDHYWVPALPSGRFRGEVVRRRLAGRPQSFSMEGSLYHDRNFGFGPIQTSSVDWFWGRVHDGGRTLILFFVQNREGSESVDSPLQIRRALLFEKDELVASSEQLDLEATMRNSWTTLKRPEKIVGRDPESRLCVTVDTKRGLESGPFYHRLLAAFSYEWGERSGQGDGTLEYLRPDRLGVALIRPFVRFRVRRRR